MRSVKRVWSSRGRGVVVGAETVDLVVELALGALLGSV